MNSEFTPLRNVDVQAHQEARYGATIFFEGVWISRQDKDYAEHLVKRLGVDKAKQLIESLK